MPADRLRAQTPDHVWALDFQHDETSDGRALRILYVTDEYTLEVLAVEVERSIDADQTVATLERLAAERGRAPELLRMDNGPELTANALRDWCRFSCAGTSYIEPGAPWENPSVESLELFDTLLEAKVLIEDWRIHYNTLRPHSSLGWMAPSRYAEWIKKEKQPA